MADLTTAAPQSAPTPQAAPSPSQAAPPAVAPPAQSQPQETPEAKDNVRRAEALARAKREQARVHADREKLAQERRDLVDVREKAKRFDTFVELRDKDVVAAAKEAGLDFTRLSKAYMEQATGTGQTPAALVAAEVDRRLAEDAKVRLEAQKQEAARLEKQTFAGAQQQLANLLKAGAEAYELASQSPERAVGDAWKIIEKHYERTKEILAFDKALAGVEEFYDQQQRELLKSSKKLRTYMDELRTSEAAAKQALSGAKAVSSTVERRQSVETQPPSPAPQPPRRRMLDHRKIASELIAAKKASSDS